MFAFEHEVDAEEDGGEDVEEVGEPEGHGGEEIAGGGIEGADGALGDGVDAEPVGEGDSFELGDDVGNAVGKSSENWRRSRTTGGRPVVKKSARMPATPTIRRTIATAREG